MMGWSKADRPSAGVDLLEDCCCGRNQSKQRRDSGSEYSKVRSQSISAS